MKKIAYTLIIALCSISYAAEAQIEDVFVKKGEFVEVTRYYDDGNIREVGTYMDGKPQGKWTEYYVDGNVKTEAYYNAGEKTGTWFVYTQDGAALYELVYVDNSLAESHKWKIEKRNLLVEK
jgi:antitoxin component YwqK of YwqJK toxin-antitoxin module